MLYISFYADYGRPSVHENGVLKKEPCDFDVSCKEIMDENSTHDVPQELNENYDFLLPNDHSPKTDSGESECVIENELNFSPPETVGLVRDRSENEDDFELPLETCLFEGVYKNDETVDTESTLCDICGGVVPKEVVRQHYLAHGTDAFVQYENNCANALKEQFRDESLLKLALLKSPADNMKSSVLRDQSMTLRSLIVKPVKLPALPVENKQPSKVEPPPKRKRIRKWGLCEICGRGFTTRYSLQNHIILRHKDEMPFTCDVCGKGILTSELLKQHYNTHTGEKPYKCQECGKSFALRASFNVHRYHHRSKTLPPSVKEQITCSICRKRLLKTSFKQHLRTHSNDNPFFCRSCDRTFNYKKSFERHICVKNSEKKAFSCKSCDAVFMGVADLNQHYRRVHKDEKNIKCDLCPKKFYNNVQLKNHMAFHEIKKTFTCNICSKEFKHARNLKLHERIHTGEKPFACDICGRCFSQRGSRDGHLLIHENRKPFSCKFCDKTFRQSTALRKHCRQAHSEEDLNEDSS